MVNLFQGKTSTSISMTTDEEKQYYFSIPTIIVGYVLTIPLIVLISFICFAFFYVLTNFSNLKYGYLMLLFCVTFFVLLTLLLMEALPRLYKFIRLYFQKIPALVLTKDKLIDNINNQVYNWTDIKSISIASIQIKTRVNFIAIALIDPDKFINKIENPYKRLITKINERYFRGAFSIQPNIIKCDNNMLFEDLTEYFKRKRG